MKIAASSAVAAAAAACLVATGAVGAEYPEKPVRWIVPFSPGGSTDYLARLVGQKLSDAWKQQVLIDNRGGAGGNIGADLAAKASPDGYTLLLSAMSHDIAPGFY